MNRRHFGATGRQVCALGMGCSRLGSFLASTSRKEAIATIRLAVDFGVDFFDTSDIYAQGESERLLGKALAQRRDSVLIATKAGRCFSSRARIAARLRTPIKLAMKVLPGMRDRVRRSRTEHLSSDFSLAHLTSALDASLKRLRTEWVDVFMLHGPPRDVLLDGELFCKLERLVEAGKARLLGISVVDPTDAPLAARLPQVKAIQLPIGKRHRSVLETTLPSISERGVAIVGREVFEGMKPGLNESDYRNALTEALRLPHVSVVLVGMSSAAHLRANLAALS